MGTAVGWLVVIVVPALVFVALWAGLVWIGVTLP